MYVYENNGVAEQYTCDKIFEATNLGKHQPNVITQNVIKWSIPKIEKETLYNQINAA